MASSFATLQCRMARQHTHNSPQLELISAREREQENGKQHRQPMPIQTYTKSIYFRFEQFSHLAFLSLTFIEFLQFLLGAHRFESRFAVDASHSAKTGAPERGENSVKTHCIVRNS